MKREILAEEIDPEGSVQGVGEEDKLKHCHFLKGRYVICFQMLLEFVIQIS